MITYEDFVNAAGSCSVPVFEVVRGRAKKKLDYIISRYGDEGGERLKDSYLIQLMIEELRAMRFSEITFSVFSCTTANTKIVRPVTA